MFPAINGKPGEAVMAHGNSLQKEADKFTKNTRTEPIPYAVARRKLRTLAHSPGKRLGALENTVDLSCADLSTAYQAKSTLNIIVKEYDVTTEEESKR